MEGTKVNRLGEALGLHAEIFACLTRWFQRRDCNYLLCERAQAKSFEISTVLTQSVRKIKKPTDVQSCNSITLAKRGVSSPPEDTYYPANSRSYHRCT